MDELREMHLGIPRPEGTGSVVAELQEAYEQAVATSGQDRPTAPTVEP